VAVVRTANQMLAAIAFDGMHGRTVQDEARALRASDDASGGSMSLVAPNTRFEHTDGGKPTKDWMRHNVSEPLDWARAGSVLPERNGEFALRYNRQHILQEFVEGVLR